MIQKSQAPILMYGDKVLGAAIEGTTSFAAEDTASNEDNQYSRPQMSFSAKVKTTNGQAREIRRLLYPLNRPTCIQARVNTAEKNQMNLSGPTTAKRYVSTATRPKCSMKKQ